MVRTNCEKCNHPLTLVYKQFEGSVAECPHCITFLKQGG